MPKWQVEQSKGSFRVLKDGQEVYYAMDTALGTYYNLFAELVEDANSRLTLECDGKDLSDQVKGVVLDKIVAKATNNAIAQIFPTVIEELEDAYATTMSTIGELSSVRTSSVYLISEAIKRLIKAADVICGLVAMEKCVKGGTVKPCEKAEGFLKVGEKKFYTAENIRSDAFEMDFLRGYLGFARDSTAEEVSKGILSRLKEKN